MSSLTQSHQVFYGRHLCLIPSTFNVMHFTQSLSSLCLTCPNHLKLLFVIIKLTRSNSNSFLSSSLRSVGYRQFNRFCWLPEKSFVVGWMSQCQQTVQSWCWSESHSGFGKFLIIEFLPLQDNGSCKNFASSSINNDYCAPDSEFLFIEMGALKFYDWLIDQE